MRIFTILRLELGVIPGIHVEYCRHLDLIATNGVTIVADGRVALDLREMASLLKADRRHQRRRETAVIYRLFDLGQSLGIALGQDLLDGSGGGEVAPTFEPNFDRTPLCGCGVGGDGGGEEAGDEDDENSKHSDTPFCFFFVYASVTNIEA